MYLYLKLKSHEKQIFSNPVLKVVENILAMINGQQLLGVWGSHKGAEGVFTMDLGFYIIFIPKTTNWRINGCFERWCSFWTQESEFCLGFHVSLVVVSNIFLCSTQPGEMIHVDLCFSKRFTPQLQPRKTNIDTKNSGMEDVSPFKHGDFPKKRTDDQGFFVDSIPFQSPSTWPPGMNSHNHLTLDVSFDCFFFGGGPSHITQRNKHLGTLKNQEHFWCGRCRNKGFFKMDPLSIVTNGRTNKPFRWPKCIAGNWLLLNPL